jgi:integrase/recombinase XerD
MAERDRWYNHLDEDSYRIRVIEAVKRLDRATAYGEITTEDHERIHELLEYEALVAKNGDGKANSTLKNRTQTLYLTAKRCETPLVDHTQESIERHLADLKSGRHPDVKQGGIGVSNYQKAYRVFYRRHDDLAITPEEIDIDNYEGRNLSPPDLLYRDDVDAILSQTRDLRDRALFALMLATGQRLDAVRTLRIKHVEADGRTMTVRLNDTEGALKGASGTVPLLWSKHYVRSWYDSHPFQDDPDAALFPPAKGAVAEEERQDPVNSDAVTKAIGRMADRAGIEKRVYPHLLRASAITRMAAKGVSEQRIKQIAGWSRDSSQFSTYVALADDINNDAAREELGYATSDQDPPVIGRPTLEACPNTGCGDPIPEGRDVCPTCGFDLSAPTDTEEPDPDADAVITAEEHGRHDAELLTDFAQSLGAWMKHEAEADDGADPLEMADAMTRITPDEVEQLMNNE